MNDVKERERLLKEALIKETDDARIREEELRKKLEKLAKESMSHKGIIFKKIKLVKNISSIDTKRQHKRTTA